MLENNLCVICLKYGIIILIIIIISLGKTIIIVYFKHIRPRSMFVTPCLLIIFTCANQHLDISRFHTLFRPVNEASSAYVG